MAQTPPPPSQPGPTGGTPASGSNTKTNVILAYLLWWVTGLIFLFVGKDDPDVKWNAAQSVVVLGGLWLIAFIIQFIYSPISLIIYLVGVIYWVIFLYGAFNYKGGRIAAPGIGQFTDQLTTQLADAVK
jgi:uncharacterized membrane protein